MGLCLRTALLLYVLELIYLGLMLYDSRRDAAQLASVVTYAIQEKLR